jgi:hypothetical protein
MLAVLLALGAGCGKPTAGSTPPAAGGGAELEDDTEPVDVAEPVDASAARPTEPVPVGEPVEELYIDGVRLRLLPRLCRLDASFLDQERRFDFRFPGACHFGPDAGGRPWVVSTDHGKAVLVVGSSKLESGACDTALQVVVITERGPELSREIQRVSGCGPGPWDEMMVHVLASDRGG